MNKRLTIFFMTCLVAPAHAMDMIAMMKQEMEASTQRICNDSLFLTCTGSTSGKCLSAARKAISACDHLFPKSEAAMGDMNSHMAHSNCMDSKITKALGISLNKLNACDPEGAGDPGGMPPVPGGMSPMSDGMPPIGNQQGLDSPDH